MAEDFAAQGGGGLEGQVSTNIEAPQTQAQEQAQTLPSFLDQVPSELKDREWVGRFASSEKPIETLFKSYDSANSMLGKRVEIPGADASPETVKAFYKALGVPEKVEGYEYKAPDLSQEPEAIQKLYNEHSNGDKLIEAMRPIAMEAGMTAKQFSAMAAGLDAFNLTQIKALAVEAEAQQERVNQEARSNFEAHYGGKTQADQVERVAHDMAAKLIPPEVAKLGPDIALIHVLHEVYQKFYKNGSIASTVGDAGTLATTVHALQAEIDKARKDPAWDDKMDPRHAEHHKYVMSLYERQEAVKQGR